MTSAPRPSTPSEPATDLDRRLRAVADVLVADVRESAGLHEYDGRVPDLSPDGVRRALADLGRRSDETPLPDPHDEAHLTAFEDSLRWRLETFEAHRRDPYVHVSALDLACYDRDYAPAEQRAQSRRTHLAAWPDAVDAALESLDQVPAPVATALLPAARGLSAGVDAAAGDVEARALAAHGRLVAHLEECARTGPPDTAIGAAALAAEMGLPEALDVDLTALAARADAERDRLRGILEDGCARIDATVPPAVLVPRLLADHPDASGVLDEARALTEKVIEWTREHRMAPHVDGECLVGPAPESRSWAMAMMSWAGPYEPESPSWYHVTPPDPSWPEADVEEWLAVFSRTTLPAITIHEVAPGHFAHGRSLRRAATPVRRVLGSATFAEGWAHYVEEVALEEGFADGDPRYAVGMALEALVRVTRLAAAIGLHTGGMTVEEATARFEADAFLGGSAARSEAMRGTFDVGYGRYTWGKLAILDLREQARASWGDGFSLERFHTAMLDLGSPPIGLLGTAVDRG